MREENKGGKGSFHRCVYSFSRLRFRISRRDFALSAVMDPAENLHQAGLLAVHQDADAVDFPGNPDASERGAVEDGER